MVATPRIHERELTGQARVRPGWFGRLILQVQVLTTSYKACPAPPGSDKALWREAMLQDASRRLDWRDADWHDMQGPNLEMVPAGRIEPLQPWPRTQGSASRGTPASNAPGEHARRTAELAPSMGFARAEAAAAAEAVVAPAAITGTSLFELYDGAFRRHTGIGVSSSSSLPPTFRDVWSDVAASVAARSTDGVPERPKGEALRSDREVGCKQQGRVARAADTRSYVGSNPTAVPMWPAGLLDRVKAAEKRIEENAAPRRIPADPNSDVDLVLAEVRYLIEGNWPPFWIKQADGAVFDPDGVGPVHAQASRELPSDRQEQQ